MTLVKKMYSQNSSVPEGSGAPVVEKRDLSAGGSDKVTFTSVAPIRGQGVRGEEILKNKTGKLKFGTFSVEVDLIRHAVAWTQVIKLMRFTGKTIRSAFR